MDDEDVYVLSEDGVEQAHGLIVDLWVVTLDQGNGERMAAFDAVAPDGSQVPFLLVTSEREVLERIDFEDMARREQATVRLRHFRACHDQGEFKP
jgi:hypothetical protein